MVQENIAGQQEKNANVLWRANERYDIIVMTHFRAGMFIDKAGIEGETFVYSTHLPSTHLSHLP